MKTKFLVVILFIILAIAYCSNAATIVVKISQFPNTTTPGGNDLFLLASGATNKNITWNQLKDAIGTNGSDVYYITTNYVDYSVITNLFVTNAYFQDFHGKTTFIENSYITNLFVTNAYITNLHTMTNYIEYNYSTNLYSSNAYITNLFLTDITTNYFLFTTNIYQSYPTYVNNTYVSNYFQTNAFLNTYVSNYFNTNQYLYYTNIYHYSTNLTVTNFYLTDNYISNFFNTNIFNVDNSVSNFFATNIYNTINIYSNYTYQYDMNLTNPVFYGHAWIDGYANNPNPAFTVLSPNGYNIELDGETGDISASGINADTFRTIEWTWDGPTNSMDMWTTDQYYRTYTPCQITGFTDKPSDSWISWGHGWNGLLTITNASSTNILLTFPASLIIPERTNQVTISNASQGMLSIKFSTQSGTNGVYRQF